MKKTFLLISFCFFVLSTTGFAQTIDNSNVPASVTSAFTSAFANAKNVKWEMDYDNYIARFKKKKTEIAVTYNKDGKWVSTETPVTRTSLPSAVKAALDKEFSSYKENEIEKVESREGINYNLDLEYNQINYNVVISEKGELITKDLVRKKEL